MQRSDSGDTPHMQADGERRIGVIIDVPTMTADQYETVAKRLGWTDEHPAVPDGLLVHAAGPTSSGWRIVDVWRDEASFRRFSSTTVAAAVQGLGLPVYEPQLFPLHHCIGVTAHDEPGGTAAGM